MCQTKPGDASTAPIDIVVILVSSAHAKPQRQHKEDLGKYVSDNSGQYVHDDSGRYIHDHSGDYIPDGLGGYLHDGAGGYTSDDSGIYKNDGIHRRSDIDSYKSAHRVFTNSFADKSATKSQNSKYGQIGSVNLLGAGSTPAKHTLRPDSTFGDFASAASPVGSASKLSGTTYDQGRYSNPNGKWKIKRQGQDVDTDGYHWEFETENKIIAEESGKLANKGTEKEGMRAKGFYQYMGPDNVPYSVTYTADENGFLPVGSHLPTPPPIPVEILRALDYLRSHGKL
ncbi:larval cuticle protein LCP-30-like [Photinus pyralis]|uniref:larval cuticle protein LCP-30-like n=1 Tax=Photinus pyralis TaxID=7054 RepID=UPI0012676903|nr:larval cuticle protein LCP-30-like [Photinus pyralis]